MEHMPWLLESKHGGEPTGSIHFVETSHIDPWLHAFVNWIPRFLFAADQSPDCLIKAMPIGLRIRHGIHSTISKEDAKKFSQFIQRETTFIHQVKELAVKAHFAHAMHGQTIIEPLVVRINFSRFAGKIVQNFNTCLAPKPRNENTSNWLATTKKSRRGKLTDVPAAIPPHRFIYFLCYVLNSN
jgi:hypothetical protein